MSLVRSDFNLVPHMAVSLTFASGALIPGPKSRMCKRSTTTSSTENKGLFWIEGTTCRFGGYDYFGEKQNSEDTVCVH